MAVLSGKGPVQDSARLGGRIGYGRGRHAVRGTMRAKTTSGEVETMLECLAVRNYRTLRDFVIPLGPLNLITGANGSGKSNVYKALRVLSDTAQGGVVASLAREGGLQSALWAGPAARDDAPVSMAFGFRGAEFSYCIDLGLPAPSASAFAIDAVIKGETVWAGTQSPRDGVLVERRNSVVRTRAENGKWDLVHQHLGPWDSMLSQFADPRRTPELLALRDQVRSWRFYDHFRTDAAAPARLPQVGTYTPVLDADGANLAAALQTIREIGDAEALDEAVADAFPGASVHVDQHAGRFETVMHQDGLQRPLAAAELSDGTLRYLLWIAALLSPRPPSLLVLNEPETSLHPDLLPALGRLIGKASERTQVFVVSHARRLIAALEGHDCLAFTLDKQEGETVVIESPDVESGGWTWFER
jgi:predicted ATPase